MDVTEPEVRFEESWLNILAVLVQATFYKMPIENENLEHDGPTPNLSNDRALAENRWARVMDEFVAQSSKYDTPHSLVQAHCNGIILQSQSMLPSGTPDPPRTISYEGISGLVEYVEDLAYHTSSLRRFSPITLLPSAVYAGIHMSAWNATFPTNFELQAWRACCIFLAAGPVIAGFGNFIFLVSRGSLPFNAILKIHIFFHYCAKVFIVVESFISLRLVPIGVYWTPMWLLTIPHA